MGPASAQAAGKEGSGVYFQSCGEPTVGAGEHGVKREGRERGEGSLVPKARNQESGHLRSARSQELVEELTVSTG